MQSVTADFYNEEDRGKVFGTLHLTSAAGAAFGGLYATNMGKLSICHAHHCAIQQLIDSVASGIALVQVHQSHSQHRSACNQHRKVHERLL